MAEWVGITGSREYRQLDRVRAYIRSLPQWTVLVFGDARGVDTVAREEAERIGLRYQCLPAHWQPFGLRAGPWRNEAIVRCADRIVAFWDGQSGGTKSAIDFARQYGKPCQVIWQEAP